ncbi:hypothetical protein [uncultured Hoeflea sp.]|uniref:hypothetical protein n=1 Tax=uncultured Hoeflea sp. TaxID=538666 RepID=UPI00262A107D|nr:hypothetical protein [uncultured Hoeflea sp.]
MIVGKAQIVGDTLETHITTYMIAHVTAISVSRPFLPLGATICLGTGGFAAAYFDLLSPGERLLVAGLCIGALLFGWKIGRLELISRDLNGSPQAFAVYGTHGDLNERRKLIAKSKRSLTMEPSS